MSKASILIIEDELNNCKVLKKFLESKGYTVDYAVTAKDGLKKIKAKAYDLMLIDVHLPDMLGTKILAELKKIHQPSLKIILSGTDQLQHAVDALNLGAHAFISKPFILDKLLATIEVKLHAKKIETDLSDDKISEWLEERFAKLAAKS